MIIPLLCLLLQLLLVLDKFDDVFLMIPLMIWFLMALPALLVSVLLGCCGDVDGGLRRLRDDLVLVLLRALSSLDTDAESHRANDTRDRCKGRLLLLRVAALRERGDDELRLRC